MKPTRGILTRSLSAMSDVSNKVSLSLWLVPKRKGDDKTPGSNDGEHNNSAYVIATESDGVSERHTIISFSQYASTAGCRQGGYFDALELDFGIPKVPDDDLDDLPTPNSDASYEFADFPTTPTDESHFSGDAPLDEKSKSFKTLRRIRSSVRRLTVSLRPLPKAPTSTPVSDAIRPLSPTESLVTLAFFNDAEGEPEEELRFSVASDATTGSLARYLAQRQSSQKVIERSLARGNGMSILAYEREGSWLIASDDNHDSKFACPFPQCEAHYGHRHISRPRVLCNQKPRRPVETVFEDRGS